MERTAEDVIRGRVHTLTRREYAIREKLISVVINDRGNQRQIVFKKCAEYVCFNFNFC